MEITVLTFASLKARLGFEKIRLEISEGASANSVFTFLNLPPEEQAIWQRSCCVAVNARYVAGDQVLHHGDEVAIIPPVAGG